MDMIPKKDDIKIIVDKLKQLGILTPEYTGKLTLHMTQGCCAGVQIDQLIKPR